MGRLRNLAQTMKDNPALFKSAGELFMPLLKQRQENRLNELTQEYERQMKEIGRPSGMGDQTAYFNKLNEVNQNYLSKISSLGEEYQKRANDIVKARQDAIRLEINDKQSAIDAQRREDEYVFNKKTLPEAKAKLQSSPLYQQYVALTASPLKRGSEDERKAKSLLAQFMASVDKDPELRAAAKIAPDFYEEMRERFQTYSPDTSAYYQGLRRRDEQLRLAKEAQSRFMTYGIALDESDSRNLMFGDLSVNALLSSPKMQKRMLDKVLETVGSDADPNLIKSKLNELKSILSAELTFAQNQTAETVESRKEIQKDKNKQQLEIFLEKVKARKEELEQRARTEQEKIKAKTFSDALSDLRETKDQSQVMKALRGSILYSFKEKGMRDDYIRLFNDFKGVFNLLVDPAEIYDNASNPSSSNTPSSNTPASETESPYNFRIKRND